MGESSDVSRERDHNVSRRRCHKLSGLSVNEQSVTVWGSVMTGGRGSNWALRILNPFTEINLDKDLSYL
jgi:hypothetical protein